MKTMCQVVTVTLVGMLALSVTDLNLGQKLFAKGKRIHSDADLIFSGENAGDGHWSSNAVDIDGDSYDDLIVGAQTWNNEQGRVYIYYGGSDMDNIPDLIVDGEPDAASRFGLTIGAGDVDNDGYGDFIVGAGQYKGNTGRAYLFYGPREEGWMEATAADLFFDEDIPANSRFSVAWSDIIVDDIDGDGFDDIFINAMTYVDPETGRETGRGYLYWGSDRANMNTGADLTFDEPEARWYGVGKAAGDIDGDGYLDLVIGSNRYPSAGDDIGRIYLYWGDTKENMDADADVVFDAPDPGSIRYGTNIGVGDVDGDGYADIAVGAYWGGRAYLYYGKSIVKGGEAPEPDLTFYGEAEYPAYSYFGELTIIGGDVNGDGYADVLIGDRAYDNWSRFVTWRGRAYLFHGGDPMDNIPDRIFDGENRGDWMGDPPGGTFGNFDGVWPDDFTISARMWPGDDEKGRVYLYYGSAALDPPVADAGQDQTVTDVDGDGQEMVTLDGSGSHDPDGTITAYEWDLDGDGNIDLTGSIVNATFGLGVHTVTLTVTDNDGLTDSDQVVVTVAKPGGAIILSASGYKVKGRHTVDLEWTGAVTTSVYIYRDGALLTETENDGFFTDHIGRRGRGSYIYQVCETGEEGNCSNETVVTF